MNFFDCTFFFEHGSHGFFFKKDKMADDLGQCLVISAWKLRIQYPHKIALKRIKSMRPPNYSEIRNGAGRNFMPEGQFYAIYWRWQFSGSPARLLMPVPLPFYPFFLSRICELSNFFFFNTNYHELSWIFEHGSHESHGWFWFITNLRISFLYGLQGL